MSKSIKYNSENMNNNSRIDKVLCTPFYQKSLCYIYVYIVIGVNK